MPATRYPILRTNTARAMPEKTRHIMVTAGGERNAARYRLAVQSQEI